MKCPHCGFENRESAEFCGECGKSLVQDIICPHCGTPNPQGRKFCDKCGHSLFEHPPTTSKPPAAESTSFASGRYQVKTLLGEGGKKKVYLAHDNTLDRDVAFALIKTENLDEDARKRITREAQAMGKLGDHPNIVAIFDMGEHDSQPFIVLPQMTGGDIESLIEKAPDHKLPIEQVIGIGKCVCSGLEFAHSKSIIHRDLKPGNVWLSDDGTAKIGDFGLAVVSDVSRLTQEGMMVGTVSYMPPEQAMGGELSPKADLYSLGAMLYEMVTGRPPFVGDDSVAIIGQHINTPPVSPTWHRADLPASLEALIMLLLDKDPQKRPASAKDVLQALESIETGEEKESTVEAQVPTENPLYRRVFVGREQELKQLQSAFDGSISGQGALMMVVGEPGIGKTAVCEQLSTYVTLRGGKTLVGHCYEEGSLSLPYLAFVEAMRSYVLDREVEDLKEELGSGASDVARIVSEVRDKLKVEPRQGESPEEDRYRLLYAVTNFLSNAASVKPMLVILEDLHDADKGTLEMLSYVSRNLSNTRLLIIGTYRDVEVDRNHPLSAALAELRRASSFERVLLQGLNADEVSRMLKDITGDEVPWGLAEAVHNQTEGNPLFVQEVVRYLTEEKLLVRAGDKMVATSTTSLEMSIPEGLRDVIGKRLSSLSEECNRLLSIAAVIGREFRLDVLQKVSDLSEDEVLTSIEEAKRVAIIEERSAVGTAISYRFAHAFFRSILYEENIAPRRIRLHQQVARALEEVYANRLQEHASELAEHFSYSTEPGDLTKAVSYGEMAAQRATDVYDYGEAARLLQQALKVQEVLDPGDKVKRCDLLTALGKALTWSGEPRRALDVEFPEAFTLAEVIGDNSKIVNICISADDALYFWGFGPARGTSEALQWAERADYYSQPDTPERGWADYFLGIVKCMRALQTEGLPLIWQARKQALERDDPNLLLKANVAYLTFGVTPWSAEEALQVAEELITKATRTYDGFTYAGLGFVFCGRRKKAYEMFQACKEFASRSGQINHSLSTMSNEARFTWYEGRLQEAVEILDHLAIYGQEVDLKDYAFQQIMFAGHRLIFYLGSAEDYPESALWRIIPEELSKPVYRRIPILQAYLGQTDEAKERLERMLQARPNITSKDDLTQAWTDIQCLEAAVLVEHHQAVDLLFKRFAMNTLSFSLTTTFARTIGAAAGFLEKYDEARSYYQEAIKVSKEMRIRPELALTRLQLAELLLDHYPDEKKEALEHLDFAINEFREMKMKPYLERALRRKEILGA